MLSKTFDNYHYLILSIFAISLFVLFTPVAHAGFIEKDVFTDFNVGSSHSMLTSSPDHSTMTLVHTPLDDDKVEFIHFQDMDDMSKYVKSSFDFEISHPSLITLDDTTLVLSYSDNENIGNIKTFEIHTNGTITKTSSLEIGGFTYNSLALLDSTTVVITYPVPDTDEDVHVDLIQTFNIKDDGKIDSVSLKKFSNSANIGTPITALNSTSFAISYLDGFDGYVKTFNIQDDGQIDSGYTSSIFTFDEDTQPSLIALNDTSLAISYQDDSGVDVHVKTFIINSISKTIDTIKNDITSVNQNVDKINLIMFESNLALSSYGEDGYALETFDMDSSLQLESLKSFKHPAVKYSDSSLIAVDDRLFDSQSSTTRSIINEYDVYNADDIIVIDDSTIDSFTAYDFVVNSLTNVSSNIFAFAVDGGDDGTVEILTFKINDGGILSVLDRIYVDGYSLDYGDLSLTLLDENTLALALIYRDGIMEQSFIRTIEVNPDDGSLNLNEPLLQYYNDIFDKDDILEDISDERFDDLSSDLSLIAIDDDTLGVAFSTSTLGGQLRIFNVTADERILESDSMDLLEYKENDDGETEHVNTHAHSLIHFFDNTYAMVFSPLINDKVIIQIFEVDPVKGKITNNYLQTINAGSAITTSDKSFSLIAIDERTLGLAYYSYSGLKNDGTNLMTLDYDSDSDSLKNKITILDYEIIFYDGIYFPNLFLTEDDKFGLIYGAENDRGFINTFNVNPTGLIDIIDTTKITNRDEIEYVSALQTENYLITSYFDHGDSTSKLVSFLDDFFLTKIALIDSSSNVDGIYGLNSIIDIDVTFDDRITIKGTDPQLELGLTNKFADYISGNNTDTLKFRYIVQEDDKTNNFSAITLKVGGSLLDSEGNEVNLKLLEDDNIGSFTNNINIGIFTDEEVNLANKHQEGFVFTADSTPPSKLYYTVIEPIKNKIFKLIIDESMVENNSFNLSSLVINATDTQEKNVKVTFADNTKATVSPGFTGDFFLPTSFSDNCDTYDPVSDLGDQISCVTMGVPGDNIKFDKPVRILFVDQSSGLSYYIDHTDTTNKITNTCPDDSGDSLTDNKLDECFIAVGDDMIIWTNHFTAFGTSEQNESSDSSGSSSSGSDSSSSSSRSSGSSSSRSSGSGSSSSSGTSLPAIFSPLGSNTDAILSINENYYTKFDVKNNQNPYVAKTGDSLSLDVKLLKYAGVVDIEKMTFYVNYNKHIPLLDNETYILFNDGEVTTFDPTGLIADTSITKTPSGYGNDFTIEFAFNNIPQYSNVFFIAMDSSGRTSTLSVDNAFSIVSSSLITNTDPDCGAGTQLVDGMCQAIPKVHSDPDCGAGTKLVDGMCEMIPKVHSDPDCGEGTELKNGMCVTIQNIQPDTQPPVNSTEITTADPECDEGTKLVDGMCEMIPKEDLQTDNKVIPSETNVSFFDKFFSDLLKFFGFSK